MCNNYASYMKVKKSKTKPVKEVNIREIVRDEMQKSLTREKHIISSESILKNSKNFKTAKKKFMFELLKPSFNNMIKNSFAQGIASNVIKSIIKKF